MSKHSKSKKAHGKENKEPNPFLEEKAEPAEAAEPTDNGSAFSLMSDDKADEREESEDGEKGVFRNVATLNGKKSGGHEPIAFIPPNPPQDFSAQASLDAHKAAEEDKDPADVQQELSHKEILDGALDPSSPSATNKDLPDAGKNPDAAVGSEAPADEKKPDAAAESGQATDGLDPTALAQPSTDGSEAVSDTENAVGTDAGSTPSAS